MKNLYVKIKTGFRADQYYTIPAEEAHKAYYLFLHPTERGVFSNGLAVRGQDIQGIEPDYNATMGWNPFHTLDADDMEDIQQKGIDTTLRAKLRTAQDIARKDNPRLMGLPLSEARTTLGEGAPMSLADRYEN